MIRIETSGERMPPVTEALELKLCSFLDNFTDDELTRLGESLRLHLASPGGRDDVHVDALLEAVEFVELSRA